MHDANAAPSRLHSKVPGSVEVNAKLASVAVVLASGPAVIVVSGTAASTVQAWLSLLELFAASVTVMVNV